MSFLIGEPKPEERMHLEYLDGLRAVAAIFVVFCHALLQVDPGFSTMATWNKGGLIFVFSYGRFAVDLFIVLSGFCLMLPVAAKEGRMRYPASEFLRRRFWRILPPYYLATIFSLVLIWLVIGEKTGTHWDISLPVSVHSIWTHALLMHDAFGEDFTINHALWSVAVEWRIYFLFPALVYAWRRFGPAWAAMIAIVASFVLMRVCQKSVHATLTANYLGLFAMGMWSASTCFPSSTATRERLRKLPWGSAAVCFIVLAAVVQDAPSKLNDVTRQCLADYLAGLAFAAMLTVLALDGNHPLHRLLAMKPLVFVGTFAYSIYLIHSPLLQVVWQIFSPLQTHHLSMFLALCVIGVPLIVGISYLFYLACERPFLRQKIRLPISMVAKTVEEPAP